MPRTAAELHVGHDEPRMIPSSIQYRDQQRRRQERRPDGTQRPNQDRRNQERQQLDRFQGVRVTCAARQHQQDSHGMRSFCIDIA